MKEAFIKWEEAGRHEGEVINEKLEEFRQQLHDLRIFAVPTVAEIEGIATQMQVDDGKQKKWAIRSCSGPGVPEDAEARIASGMDKLTKLVEPLIGMNLQINTAHVCRRQEDGKTIETSEEFGQVLVEGTVKGVCGVIVEEDSEFDAAMDISYGKRTEADGSLFEQYRFCIVIDDGEVLVPLAGLDTSNRCIQPVR